VQKERTGNLFGKNFERKAVDSETYFTNLIAYLHRNPQRYGICHEFEVYPYSSCGRHLQPRPSKLQKEAVLNWFGGTDAYQQCHQTGFSPGAISQLLIEDDSG
jgi:putative transposase